MDEGMQRRRKVRGKQESESRSGRKKKKKPRGGREEFGEVEENVNLRKAA